MEVSQRAIRLCRGETQRSSSNISCRNRLLCGLLSRKPGCFAAVLTAHTLRRKMSLTR